MDKLLTRDEFRKQTLARNNGNCVVPNCSQKAVDAHHILNRNLFIESDELGGYFYNNGAGLCSAHHLEAEITLVPAKNLYVFCSIDTPRIPNHFTYDNEYDTWGNIINSVYQRTPGELFEDEGCQKALAKGRVLWQFGQ